MMRRSNAWLPVGILAILAITSLWLKEVVDSAAGSGRGRVRHDPDLIVDGFSIHQLDATGRTRYTLKAQVMSHFPDDDSAVFDKVSMMAFEPGQPPLKVAADEGERLVRQDLVKLRGHVRVDRLDSDPAQPPLVLLTNYLEVYLDRERGWAPGPVVLTHGLDRLEADTMTFDFKLSTAQFTRARTLFPPRPR